MSSPSVQLLRVLRSAELLQSSLRGLQRASQLRPSKLIPSTSTYRPVSSSSPSSTSISQVRYLSTGAAQNRSKMSTTDRGPPSKEDTQTDFGDLNVLGSMPAPTTSIDACLTDGFHFDNGLKISGGSGCLLVAGEAFSWRPWEAFGDGGEERKKRMLNQQGQWDVQNEAWGLLDVVWPKPDLLILGLGASTYPISPETRQFINSLGIRVDIQDTRNAAAQFNLLATERGVGNIAAALIPIGWKGR